MEHGARLNASMSHLSTFEERELVKKHPLALARGDHVEIYRETGIRTTKAHLLTFAQRVVARERVQPFLHNAGVEVFRGRLHTGGGASPPQSFPMRQPGQCAAALPTRPPPPVPRNAPPPHKSFHARRMARKRAAIRSAAQATADGMDVEEGEVQAVAMNPHLSASAAHQLGAPHVAVDLLTVGLMYPSDGTDEWGDEGDMDESDMDEEGTGDFDDIP